MSPPPRRLVPSGVDWIGDVPEGWKVGKVGYYYGVQLGKMLSSNSNEPTDTLERYYCAANVHFDGVDETDLKQMWFGSAEKATYKIDVGDLLVVEGGAGAGGSAIVKTQSGETYIQNSIMRVRAESEVLNAHLCYWIEFLVKSGYLDIVCNKATIPHFTKDKLSRVAFPIPPLPEQRAIAARLDAVCEKIDALKAKIEKEIAALEEYRKSLITKCVTKGLHPRRLVPSGVDWIGDVPEGWEIPKLKYLVSKIGSGKTPTGGANSYPDEGVIFLRSQNIYDEGLHLEDVEHISELTDAGMSNTRVRKNDVLLNITGGSIGRCCIYNLDESANVNQHVCIIRSTGELSPRYLHYYLNGYAEHIVNDNQQGGNRESLNFEQIGNLELLLPSLPEQREIADYLDKKCAAIDAVVAKRRKQLDGLVEYRKSVIYSYVTGKRETEV